MTWTELIAFWVTFAITFVAFISWVNLDDGRRKRQTPPNMIHHGRQRKETARADLENYVDELTRNSVETRDQKVKVEINELSSRLGLMRSDKRPQKS